MRITLRTTLVVSRTTLTRQFFPNSLHLPAGQPRPLTPSASCCGDTTAGPVFARNEFGHDGRPLRQNRRGAGRSGTPTKHAQQCKPRGE